MKYFCLFFQLQSSFQQQNKKNKLRFVLIFVFTLENVVFTDDMAILTFKSDAATQRPGFSIQVRQMTDCGQVTSSKYLSLDVAIFSDLITNVAILMACHM